MILLQNTVSKKGTHWDLVAVLQLWVLKPIDGANINLTCGFELEIVSYIEFLWATPVK